MFRDEEAACRLATFRPFYTTSLDLFADRRPRRMPIESHDMYENTAAYGKYEEIDRNRKTLNINKLYGSWSSRRKTQGELKVQAKATMFMKTKESESCNLIKATMFIITNDLYF